MGNNVIRQHYVWRRYLRPWTSKERIWAYMKSLNKVIGTNLMGVAQERFFYQLVDFTEADIAFLEAYINKSYHPGTALLVHDFLRLYSEYSRAKSQVESAVEPSIDTIRVAELLRDIEINSLERIHGKIENLGDKLVSCRSIQDLEALDHLDDERDDLLDAVAFLCVQYFRTKSIKDAAIASFPSSWTERVEKYWNIISFGNAFTLARSIMMDANRQFCFIENTTDTPFMTGDQPVFNILSDKVDEAGQVTDLALFYPLSPKGALLIQFVPPTDSSKPVMRFQPLTADRSLVEYYNQKVVENSYTYVFADNEMQVKNLIVPC